MGSQVEAAWNEDSLEIDEFVVEVPFDVGDGVVGDCGDCCDGHP